MDGDGRTGTGHLSEELRNGYEAIKCIFNEKLDILNCVVVHFEKENEHFAMFEPRRIGKYLKTHASKTAKPTRGFKFQ